MAAGYVWDGADIILRVRVQPRASRNEWVGLQDARCRIRITAPPVDGEANACLRAFLAELFGTAKNQVTLLAGEASRDKRLRVAAPRRLPAGIELQTAPVISKTHSAGSRH